MTAPVNSRWKACRPAMVRTFGEARTAVMLDRLIPLSHDGDILVLGAPSAWHRQWVMRHFGERLQKILGHPLRLEISAIAAAAEARSKAEAKAG